MSFWRGFQKTALMHKRRDEDLAVAGTSIIPLGSTIHTLAKSKKGGNRGKEWLSRMGGAGAGAVLGSLPGLLAKSPTLSSLGGLAGGAAGEVAASRLVHKHKYDSKGNLKPEYKD